ncbi:tail fiber domain-containing protein [Salmonella enterica]|nr:tail fiber domain-containing protein [Salmonella enterica]
MPPIDERTTRFDLELPAEANTLKNDVARLRDSFGKLDTNAAKLDANGKLEGTQIPDSVARLNATGLLKDDQLPLKVPLLDAAGKLPQSTIPDDARMNIMNAASEVLMLDLDATLGDVCNITQSPYKQFLLVKPDPTQRDSWRELPDKAVTSVNGRTGAVTVAEAGVNADITGLTALSGPLTLGGDAAGAYDAVTLRQLQAASGGAGGANMSGVMNNFIGAVEWFTGTRAKLPAGYIAADGQEVSQTDAATKDLFAAVDSGMLVSTDEQTWLTAPAGTKAALISARGNYVKNSTTAGMFRVPDLNGMQAGSIQGVFLRGSASGWLNGPGTVASDQLKDHTHVTYFYVNAGRNEVPSATANRGGGVIKHLPDPAGTGDQYDTKFDDYSYSPNEKYVGALSAVPLDNTNVASVPETTPRAAVGIWIIRANGSFTAGSTIFNIIRSDATRPADNVMAYGGFLYSQYMVADKVLGSAAVTSAKKLGNSYTSAILQAADGESGDLKNFEVRSDGVVTLPTGNNVISAVKSQGSIIEFVSEVICDNGMHTNPGMGCGVRAAENNYIELNNAPKAVTGGNYVNWLRAAWYNDSFQLGIVRGGSSTIDAVGLSIYATTGMKQWFFQPGDGRINSTAGIIAVDTGSDRRKKHGITPIDGAVALANINRMENVEFVYNNDQTNTLRRGFIAQQLEDIDPVYVVEHPDMEGATGDTTYSLNNGALLMDALAAIKVLAARVAELEGKADVI